MANVNWTKNQEFIYNASGKIFGILNTDWLGFLDALGKTEGDDTYSADNKQGYIGIYQFASLSNRYSIFYTLNFPG